MNWKSDFNYFIFPMSKIGKNYRMGFMGTVIIINLFIQHLLSIYQVLLFDISKLLT